MAILTLDQQRAEKCASMIQVLLQNHKCNLIPMITIMGNGQIQAGYQIVAQPTLPIDVKQN